MKPERLFRASVIIGVLAGCEPAPPPVPDMPAEDTCGAAPFHGTVGQDATVLERHLVMRPVRVIRPGMAVTMDFRPDRINFHVSEEGTISRVSCG